MPILYSIPSLLASFGVCSLLVSRSTDGFVLSMSLKSPKPVFGGIAHAGILVSDTQSSMRFYLDVLGFEDDTHLRPSTLPFPGAFVRGGAQQIHLMELPNPDPTRGRPEHGGRDRHVAFTVDNIDPLMARLTEEGVPFTMSKSGRRAVFCRDLDGNALEFMEEGSVGRREGEKEEL
ncbi:glyoxalase bleomycin resistance protein dioxygenase [Nannochloropsis gaditana]|uniref:Glyoxalase bleomycin resistance protein dioxygenase n=1 Tax=Nannochloropsis gaditana TaxID=72520 RepID=W7TIY4_9STRA|nr:glyoxalase bleomycin resistance protein dioxygenase [Nannochloropsis gaditana]